MTVRWEPNTCKCRLIMENGRWECIGVEFRCREHARVPIEDLFVVIEKENQQISFTLAEIMKKVPSITRDGVDNGVPIKVLDTDFSYTWEGSDEFRVPTLNINIGKTDKTSVQTWADDLFGKDAVKVGANG